jgi:hypothetical protein
MGKAIKMGFGVIGALVLLAGSSKGMYYFDSNLTYTINFSINDSVTISGTQTKVYLVDGGSISGDVRIEYDGASFTMSGGSIGGNIAALSSRPVTITGGTIGKSILLDSSSAYGFDGDVYIYGSDFKIDGQPVSYGSVRSYSKSGILTGLLVNGDSINNYFNHAGSNDLILMPFPEPASLLFVLAGSIMLRRKAKV